MEYERLERIVRKAQAKAAEITALRDKAEASNDTRKITMRAVDAEATGHINRCVGIGEVMSILVEEFPEEMAKITQ